MTKLNPKRIISILIRPDGKFSDKSRNPVIGSTWRFSSREFSPVENYLSGRIISPREVLSAKEKRQSGCALDANLLEPKWIQWCCFVCN